MTTGPFTVERREFAAHPYISIIGPTGISEINLELSDALDIHRQLSDILDCDDCLCWDAGYEVGKER